MFCRFENRLEQTALTFAQPITKITAYNAADLEQAWRRIDTAHQAGHWVVLVLNYELGAHLLALPFARPSTTPLLSAYVFTQAHYTTPWLAHPSSPIFLEAQATIRRHDYLKQVESIQRGIREGLFYQINHTIPIQIQSTATPQQLYTQLATAHPVEYGAYLEDGERCILSFSPELFVRRRGNTLTVKPMKGTAARHNDPARDQAAAHQLRHSAKDIAENIMIVDLLRNDLGRIADTGSVQVRQLLNVEAYPSVWTMTSTIEATTSHRSLAHLLTALFPCGSITGTPKIAAMQCIHELEQRERGIYCGSLGWLAPNGDLQLNVAIRTIEYTSKQHAQFGVGGAIVIDSDPYQEWEECLWKARVLGTPISYEE